MIKKFNWEPRSSITTISEVKQIDDDSIGFYRRHENSNMYGTTWEEVIMNRQTKEIQSRILSWNFDKSTSPIESTVITPLNEEKCVISTSVYDTPGNGSAKVEVFKH